MVYLFVLAVGFLIGVGSVCFLLAFMERDTRRAGDVIDLTGVPPTVFSSDRGPYPPIPAPDIPSEVRRRP